MNQVEFLKTQTQNSLDMYVWAIEQIPSERHEKLFIRLSDWSPHQHTYHLYAYEKLVLPVKRLWLSDAGAINPQQEEEGRRLWDAQDEEWQNLSLKDSLNGLIEVTRESIALIDEFPSDAWDTPKAVMWGAVPLKWVYSKTLQHTIEHATTMMQFNLFWDMRD